VTFSAKNTVPLNVEIYTLTPGECDAFFRTALGHDRLPILNNHQLKLVG